MYRLEENSILLAVVSIAESDGVSVKSVVDRGQEDLALRIAYRVREQEKSRLNNGRSN